MLTYVEFRGTSYLVGPCESALAIVLDTKPHEPSDDLMLLPAPTDCRHHILVLLAFNTLLQIP